MKQKKNEFPITLLYPVKKAKEIIQSLEKDIDNPKAKKFKSFQRQMSLKARELRRLSNTIAQIVSEQRPYDKKKKTPSHEAIVRGNNSNQK